MKLSELKTRLKNKYVVRIVAGVLTIALLGSSMTAVAVQADQKKDAAVQTEQKEDSSDKKDDIEDLLQVSHPHMGFQVWPSVEQQVPWYGI